MHTAVFHLRFCFRFFVFVFDITFIFVFVSASFLLIFLQLYIHPFAFIDPYLQQEPPDDGVQVKADPGAHETEHHAGEPAVHGIAEEPGGQGP